jgi:hypothetical protein
MSYAANDINRQLAVLCTTVNGSQGGIWMSGGGLSSDGTYLFAAVGNGSFDPLMQDYGNTALKLLPGNLAITDSFTPSDQQALSDYDNDFGSAEPLLLIQPDTGLNVLITADKTGRVYIINQNNMGGLESDSNGGTQEIDIGTSILNNMAYFAGYLYVGASILPLEAFHLFNGRISLDPASATAHIFGTGGDDGQGTNPVVSSNGAGDGIVWALDNSAYASQQPAVLYAYEAADLTHELYNSGEIGSQDQAGPAVKFTAPLIVNGKVFVPGGSVITVYGLK